MWKNFDRVSRSKPRPRIKLLYRSHEARVSHEWPLNVETFRYCRIQCIMLSKCNTYLFGFIADMSHTNLFLTCDIIPNGTFFVQWYRKLHTSIVYLIQLIYFKCLNITIRYNRYSLNIHKIMCPPLILYAWINACSSVSNMNACQRFRPR